MTLLVVDASVAAKWVLVEEYTDAALRLLDVDFDLIGPDLLLLELASVLRKKARRDEITVEGGRLMLQAIRRAPLQLQPSDPLLEPAWEIASEFDRGIYDCIYLALAAASGSRMVTADRKLINAIAGSRLAEHLLWVEDIP